MSAHIGVLLVEDDGVQRMALASSLREADFRVVEAVGIEEAVAYLDTELDLHVLVTDVDLPGESMTGFSFAKAVAARWPSLSILVLSGKARPLADQLPEGACFLAKPAEDHEITGAIFGLLKTRDWA